jgi:hypothetical protein
VIGACGPKSVMLATEQVAPPFEETGVAITGGCSGVPPFGYVEQVNGAVAVTDVFVKVTPATGYCVAPVRLANRWHS